MSKIKEAFLKGKAFVPFITCGDPDLETTAAAIYAAAENGADLIALGIPFSDPTAEAPVLQEASIRALKSGVNTDKVFDFLRGLNVKVPMVFVTYANVVFSYGADRFISACSEVGVGGMIIPDLPFEERNEFLPECRKHGVELISQIALNSAQRIGMIAGAAEGMLCIEAGRIGAESAGKLREIVKAVRENADVPCVMACDTEDMHQAAKMAAIADGVMLSSKMVELLAAFGKAAPEKIGEYVRTIKEAMR